MAKYILLIIIMLVSCSRKTTQTVSADHTEHRETAALTVDQWQALSQSAWQSQIRTQSESLTERIVIDAKGDTTLRDITHQREVSDKSKQGSGTVYQSVTASQQSAAKEQAVEQDKKQETVTKPPSLSISDLITGMVVAAVVIWAFFGVHKVLIRYHNQVD